MNTSLKKIMAGVTAVTLVAMNAASLTVNAAGLNGSTLTTAAVAGDITITSSGTPFALTSTITAVVNGVSRVAAVTSTSVITITDPDGTVNAAVDAGNYNISIISDQATPTDASDDVYAAVTFNNITAGTAGSHVVTVTATVAPTLSMTISNPALAFGTLVPGAAISTASNTVVISTNAVNGYNLSIQNAQAGGMVDGAKTITAATYGAVAMNSNTFGVQSITPGAGSTLATGAGEIGNAADALAATSKLALKSTTPVNASSNTVQYAVAVDATQAAGNYATSVTYSLTGSF